MSDVEAAPPVALVVTGVSDAGVLAGTLRLAGAMLPRGSTAVPTGGGAVVTAHVDRAGADGLAASVSHVLRGVPVLLLAREGSQLSATRWADGRQGATVAPGLVMSSLDDTVEGLLLGRSAPADVEGAIDVWRLGRWRAARLVAAARRSR
jgi:hypothetical protein